MSKATSRGSYPANHPFSSDRWQVGSPTQSPSSSKDEAPEPEGQATNHLEISIRKVSSEPSGPPLHPAYFETLFRTWTDPSTFPEEFVIVTAFAPTGETWTRERNLESHERLRIALEAEQDLWFAEIEGYAPDGDHAELGFGIGLPLKAGQLLGRSFGQDAIYHVHVDGLSVASCEEGAGIIPVGRFRERLRFVRHR